MLEFAGAVCDPGCAFDRVVRHIRAGLRGRFAGSDRFGACGLDIGDQSIGILSLIGDNSFRRALSEHGDSVVPSSTCQAVIVMASDRPSSPANT